jgi:hypothetical protein
MRMRYSPMNPLSPGRPIEESITTVNTAARTGATFCSPPSSAMRRVWRRS